MDVLNKAVLCVDDDPGVLAALRRIFSADFTVYSATSVEDGVQLLTKTPHISVVISDHRMPGVNGFDFLTWCQANHPGITRIVLTGYPESDLMRKALHDGLAERVVSKPWNDDDFIHELKSLIEQSGGA